MTQVATNDNMLQNVHSYEAKGIFRIETLKKYLLLFIISNLQFWTDLQEHVAGK